MKSKSVEFDLSNLVRSVDPVRYYANQFIAEPNRNDVFALLGFDIEIHKISRTVSEPIAGEIRLQWWREVFLGERNAEAASSPLAQHMRDLSSRHAIGSEIWNAYLDGRIFDLYDDEVEDQAAFEAYAGQTEGTILQLACLILDRQSSSSASQLSGNLACLLCLWNRALWPLLYADQPPSPQLIAKISRYLPPELRARSGLASNPFLESNAVDIQKAVMQICGVAENYLDKARMAAHPIPPSLRPVFLHVSSVASQLSDISSSGDFKLPLNETSTWRTIWRLWRNSKRWPCF